MDKALVEKTYRIIESVSKMESIKPYLLVGGTALSLQIQHRLSEDLDFMRWQSVKNEKMEVDISSIKKELAQFHKVENINILEFNHIEFYLEGGVKLSFYAPEKRAPQIKKVTYLNNLVLVDISTIASLKMETMMRRNIFRDYYDLYCILKEKNTDEIKEIIANALKYSGHNLKSKNLIGMLINSERFKNDSDFEQLEPKYSITREEIGAFMVDKLSK